MFAGAVGSRSLIVSSTSPGSLIVFSATSSALASTHEIVEAVPPSIWLWTDTVTSVSGVLTNDTSAAAATSRRDHPRIGQSS
ncbi:MAG: hypothetical protein WCA30_08180, partial [Dermatophilaceae bacterium]